MDGKVGPVGEMCCMRGTPQIENWLWMGEEGQAGVAVWAAERRSLTKNDDVQ